MCDWIFFFFSYPPASCHREMNILSCQEGKVMRLVLFLSLFLSLSIAAFQKLMVWFIEARRAVLLLSLKKHFISVSEAPTVLCGLRASKNLKSFLLQCIILEDHYMIYSLGGENHILIPPRCCFSVSKRRLEEGSEVLRGRFNCVWLALTFLNSNSRRKQKEKGKQLWGFFLGGGGFGKWNCLQKQNKKIKVWD